MTCSESFYRHAMIEDIELGGPFNSGHRNVNQTRASEMLELLKRFENGGISSDNEVDDGDDDELWNLSEDTLNKMTQQQLLRLLSKDQIEEFHRKLLHQQMDSEFVEATINSQFPDPWWIDYRENGLDAADEESSNLKDWREIELIDGSLLPGLSDHLNPTLPYHLFSLLLGYVALIRYYGLRTLKEISEEDGDPPEVLSGFPNFFPILFSNQARPQSISDCFSLLIGKSSSISTESIPFLMKDLKKIFCDDQHLSESKPGDKILVLENDPSEEKRLDVRPNCCTLALSDLYNSIQFIQDHNLGSSLNINLQHGYRPILRKLLFFISFISMKDSQARLDGLLQEIERYDLGLDNGKSCPKDVDDQQAQSSIFLVAKETKSHRSTEVRDIKQPKIVEVSCSNDSNEKEGE